MHHQRILSIQHPKYQQRSLYEDCIATAVQSHAPDRAVAVWQNIAEGLIAEVKLKSHEEAVKYLNKARQVMAKEKWEKEWEKCF